MQYRNKKGQYAKGGRIALIAVFILSVFGSSYFVGVDYARIAGDKTVTWIADHVRPDLVAKPADQSGVTPRAAAEIVPSLSVAELEAKLDAIVWGIESDGHVMQDGEIFVTFDPPQSWPIEKCLKVGGKVNEECYSHGPRQEKISLIQSNWPTLHSGETITEKAARDVAEGNETSRLFFLQCSEYVKGCAAKWTSFETHKTEGQIYLDLIRETKGINL